LNENLCKLKSLPQKPMKKGTHVLLFLAFALLVPDARAQEPFIMLPNTAPIYYNPAFVGSLDRGRITAAYNNEWLGFPEVWSLYASYDQVSNRLRGGLGVESTHFHADGLNVTALSGIYSPKITLGNNWTLAPAVQLGLRRLHLLFTTVSPTQGLITDIFERGHLTAGFSVLLNSGNFYLGANWGNALATRVYSRGQDPAEARPQQSLAVQAGYVISPGASAPWSLSLGGMGRFMEGRNQTLANALFRYRWILAGLAGNFTSRNQLENFNVMPSLGVKFNRFRVLATYNWVNGEIANGPNLDSAELSFMWYFNKKRADSSPGSAGM
jgi:type IX secretion system PorP/SprF family membrane protein